jgi:hypothetical protein
VTLLSDKDYSNGRLSTEGAATKVGIIWRSAVVHNTRHKLATTNDYSHEVYDRIYMRELVRSSIVPWPAVITSDSPNGRRIYI